MRFRLLCALGATASFAMACGSGDDASDATLPAVQPTSPTSVTSDDGTEEPLSLDGDWVVVDFTLEGASHEPPTPGAITMTVDGDRIGGRAACNQYDGTVSIEIDGAFGTFSVREMSVTEMGCEPALMDAEQTFLAALGQIDGFEYSGDLYLGGQDVGTSIHLTAAAPAVDAPLAGTTWVLDTLISGDAASNSPGMESAFVVFDAAQTVSGSTGCRALVGDWVSVDGGYAVTLSPVDNPAAGVCAPASAALDEQIAAVLAEPFEVSIAGRRLTLTAATGDGLSFTADAPAPAG